MTESSGDRAEKERAFEDLSRAELACVLDALPWLVTFWDVRCRLRYANGSFLQYLGLDAQNVGGMHISELVSPDLYDEYRPFIAAVLTGERQTFFRVLGGDESGTETYVEADLIPHFEAGRVDGFVMVGMDVTERVLSERALNEAGKEVTLLQERQRLAEDLHDLVIQRLFAAGLDLSAALRGGPDMRQRIQAASDGVDKAIRELRGAIHHLQELMRPSDVPRVVATMIDDATRMLGFAPRLIVSGPWSDVDPVVLTEMTAVLNESLANVAKHAQATDVQVTLAREEGLLLLRVADNGHGIGATGRRSGLANMRSRAAKLGGHFDLMPNQPHGTVAEWRVPVRR